MPGYWQLRPSEQAGRWLYRCADRREQMTITRAELSDGHDEATRLRRAVTRHRKAVELGFGRVPGLEMSEPDYGERQGVPVASYSGDADEGRHRFWALLLFPERTVWAFFFEAFRLSEAEAQARAETIFATASAEAPQPDRQHSRAGRR